MFNAKLVALAIVLCIVLQTSAAGSESKHDKPVALNHTVLGHSISKSSASNRASRSHRVSFSEQATSNSSARGAPSRSCGTPPLSESEKETIESAMRPTRRFVSAGKREIYVVRIHFHVITGGSSSVSRGQINAQIQVLNKHYQGSMMQIKFVAGTVRWIPNRAWTKLKQSSPAEFQMKNMLRIGSSADLNVYVTDFADSSLLGWSTYPQSSSSKTDGIVIRAGTMPRGNILVYNLGLTLTHEIGHWLGLYHPFEGENCDGPGDYVADTPAEGRPAFGCPVGRDSCPGKPGLDLVRNIMDYSDDSCMRNFTPGQFARMRASIQTYRSSMFRMIM